MRRQWYPSRGERKAFAIRMREDKEFREAYQKRKAKKIDKRMDGYYIPTKRQGLYATFDQRGAINEKDLEAFKIVASSWSTSTKCHHDYIHRVNECIRRADKSYED